MEDSKKDVHPLTIQTPWVKALLAFVIFLLIFMAGAWFGSHFSATRYGRYSRLQMRTGNMMFRGTGYRMPVSGPVSGIGQPKSTTPITTPASGQQGGTTSSATPVSNSASQ